MTVEQLARATRHVFDQHHESLTGLPFFSTFPLNCCHGASVRAGAYFDFECFLLKNGALYFITQQKKSFFSEIFNVVRLMDEKQTKYAPALGLQWCSDWAYLCLYGSNSTERNGRLEKVRTASDFCYKPPQNHTYPQTCLTLYGFQSKPTCSALQLI
ncbi:MULTISPECIES: hypothetical protein [Aeromonas]|uniref:Uncharacterized protein n=2 Tax=Aeromonas TaxID=642 RepID=A0AAX3P676_AERHY|nr:MULTISPECIES: hypothetical protein [Aeromonas]HDT5864040.1 hypothetical protein [Aeromonas hydrophila subsp. hydrophila]WEE26956.1 hypothetical protein PY771_01140 [Aeromonas hydrophila]WGC86008.1 hypothetical protein OJY61_22190 [Aeromonas caviae]BBG88102.1 hypothetical protein ACGSH8M1_007680 [Aeromonas caviae]HDT5895274.1 hypothetical protein [Aeromonas hydrophila subsp. hydrophila]